MNNKRWYDQEPTVSLAVSLIKNSNHNIQIECAHLIKNKAQDYGVVLHLKEADDETRKQIAIEIIGFLEKAETIQNET